MFSVIINGTENLRSPNPCNQGNKYMTVYRTTLCINIMQLIPLRSKRVRSYIYLNFKFHDYSIFLRLSTLLSMDYFSHLHTMYTLLQLVHMLMFLKYARNVELKLEQDSLTWRPLHVYVSRPTGLCTKLIKQDGFVDNVTVKHM